jgi:prepilin-type N-terminal cleavage/methylation domain
MTALVSPRRRAFTLIELLTVIAIIGILAAITIPLVGKVRARAESSRCISNLRQLYGVCMLYANDNKGCFPDPNNKDAAAGDRNWWDQTKGYYSLATGTKTVANNGLRCTTHLRRITPVVGREVSQTYGLNHQLGITTGSNPKRRTLASLPSPATTLMISECGYYPGNVESALDRYYIRLSASSDGTVNAGSYIGGVHDGANNILWADGHVSVFRDVGKLAEAEAVSTYWRPGF